MHQPVLLQEVIQALEIHKEGVYIDATFGEGGHAKEIIKLGGRVLGIEQDISQVKSSKLKVQSSEKLILIHGNFRDIEKIAKDNGFFPADGIVFDLGLSMKQLQEGKKGLSYKKKEELLDMRLGENIEQTAADIINSSTAETLYEIFSRYSEEINSRAIANALVRPRSLKPVHTVGDLVAVLDTIAGTGNESVYRRIFQALRIAVNNELENLKKGLEGAINILKKDGVIAIISFHSVEDRIIKQFIKSHGLRQAHKNVITGVKGFAFERSAKLRIIEKPEHI